MAAANRRVVVTGIGVISPIGLNAASFWEGLQQGRSGIKPFRAFDISPLTTRIAGEIPEFDAKNYIDKDKRKSLRMMARGIQLAVSAAQLCLDDSKVDKAKLDPTRFGIEFGAGLLPTELLELGPAAHTSVNCEPGFVDLKTWGEKGIPAIPPLWMLKYLPNMLACHVSILHNAQGPNNSITEGDVAGLLALGEAFRIIRRDQADFFLVGGADSKLNPLSVVRQCLFGHLSRRNDAPEKASRPFDKQRDGMVIGEGSGVLAVEELEHARRRGATIYAEVVGIGGAFNRKGQTIGLARAAQAAMNQADITADDLDHINAHGLGTVKDDAREGKALQELLGSVRQPVPLWAGKSYFGNLGAGSGTTELSASLLALKHGTVPATLNCDEPDVPASLRVIQKNQPLTRSHVLKVGFNDMGQCAAVVCKKWAG
jgi:3-oxoacyl-[acyl-carrier-protein] synthase II